MTKVKSGTNEKLVIDGDRLLRDLRLPWCTMAKLRQMRIGDAYQLFDFYGPPMSPGQNPSNTGATIERVRGGFFLNAGYMLHVSNAKRHGHILCLDTLLVMLPNRRFEVLNFNASSRPVSLTGLRLFVRVVRFAHRLSKMAEKADAKEDAWMMRPAVYTSTSLPNRYGYRIPFLDTIAAKPMR